MCTCVSLSLHSSEVACINESRTSGRVALFISRTLLFSAVCVFFAAVEGVVPPKRAHFMEADRSMLAQQKRVKRFHVISLRTTFFLIRVMCVSLSPECPFESVDWLYVLRFL